MAEPAEVERIIAEGRAAHPSLTAAPADLTRLVSHWFTETALPASPDGSAVRPIDAAELVLACACALRDPVAIATFERLYFGVLPAALARLSLGRDEIAEVEQIIRVRLLVGDGETIPRIVGYAGRGQLGGLVRVAAVRAGLNLLRDRGRLDDAGEENLEDLPVSADDPEFAQLKAQHRTAFKAAFEDAIASLEPRERSLLNLAIVKNLGIDRIGAIYGVHRATAARWVASARENLTRAVHKRLAARLDVGASSVGDLLPLVQSQLELSLDRLLRSRVEADGDRNK